MARRTTPPTASDDQVRALLGRHHCPVPFHAVRTRLLGNIASPAMQGSPIRMVEALWGGELPTFDSIDDANELIGALVMGLWNRLTRHQERSAPFSATIIVGALIFPDVMFGKIDASMTRRPSTP